MENLSLVYARTSILIFNVFFAVSGFQFYEFYSQIYFHSHTQTILLNGFQLTGSILMAISCIIYSEYLRYEHLTGTNVLYSRVLEYKLEFYDLI